MPSYIAHSLVSLSQIPYTLLLRGSATNFYWCFALNIIIVAPLFCPNIIIVAPPFFWCFGVGATGYFEGNSGVF